MPNSIVFKTLNYAADLNFILNPRATPKIPHQKPTLLERIAGIVALILLVPLTLGIGTAFYLVGAYLKVTEIQKDNQDISDTKVKKVFGDIVKSIVIDRVTTNQIDYLKKALESIQNDKKETAIEFINGLSAASFTRKGKWALFETAVQYDRTDLVDWLHYKLLKFDEEIDGAELDDPEGKYEYWYTSALYLDQALSAKMVKKLIALKANVNGQVNREGETPIYHARSKEIAELLHKAGARFYKKDGTLFTKKGNKKTPLHTVSNADVARFLIETYKLKVQDFNKRDTNGKTALYNCVREDIETAKVLIEKGADVTIGDNYLETPLHRCKDPEIAEMLIAKGANVNAMDDSGEVPLHSEYPEIIKVLIKNGANVKVKDRSYGSVLRNHIYSRNYEIASLLIDAGSDVNICQGGWTGYSSADKYKLTLNTSCLIFVLMKKWQKSCSKRTRM